MAKEPLGDLLYDLCKDVAADGAFYMQEGCSDLVEKAHTTVRALQAACKKGTIAISSPTLIRTMAGTQRKLKKILEDEYGDHKDEELDVDDDAQTPPEPEVEVDEEDE